MTYQPPVAVPTEFALLAECCRWCFAKDNERQIARLAETADWSEALALAHRHRVEGLAWHALHSTGIAIPRVVRSEFADAASVIADHGLRAAAFSAAIHKTLDDAGVDHLFVKGLTVAKLAYGNPFLKMSMDIDLLVAPDRIAATADILEGLGFGLVVPSDRVGLAGWHRRRKESVWSDQSGMIIDLHSRLADSPRMIPDVGLTFPRQSVEIAPKIALPTLQNDALFAYLCVHGGWGAWFRLKWLADLAALIHRREPTAIADLHDRAVALGAGRTAGQALLLAAWLFQIELGPSALRLDRGFTRWLAQAALDELLDPREPTERRLGTVRIHLTQLTLQPGLRFTASELVRQARDLVS